MTKLIFNQFTDADDNEILNEVKSIGDVDWASVSCRLKRPEYVVIQRAFQLGAIRFNDYNHVLISHRFDGWRSDEIDFLLDNVGKHSAKVIANAMGRSDASVRKQIYEFQLSCKKDRTWSEDELDILRDELNQHGTGHVAKKTDRRKIDVKHQAIKQGLSDGSIMLTLFGKRRSDNEVGTLA